MMSSDFLRSERESIAAVLKDRKIAELGQTSPLGLRRALRAEICCGDWIEPQCRREKFEEVIAEPKH